MLTFLVLVLGLGPQNELKSFMNTPTPEYQWKPVKSQGEVHELELTSQKWQGFTWKHSLVVADPQKNEGGDVAILYITGDRVENKDLPFIKKFADMAKMPVATVFDVPNQPIYDAQEDALIAITFGKYIETGDPTWPLLFPMTKSALKAMDAVTEWSKGKIKRFVVTGASKRGWTTWLVGATGDKRVIGIAPMVIDMVNMPKQIAYQKESWGRYSNEINDYVETGLIQMMEMERGKKLIKMVDPYSYLDAITIPKLIVLGGNDQYWTVDAHRWYWNELKGQKLMRIVPNAGHNLNGGKEAAESVAFFAGSLQGRIPGGLPKLDNKQDRRWRANATWTAQSKDLWFHGSTWTSDGAAPRLEGATKQAGFSESIYEYQGLKASFTSTVTVGPLK